MRDGDFLVFLRRNFYKLTILCEELNILKMEILILKIEINRFYILKNLEIVLTCIVWVG